MLLNNHRILVVDDIADNLVLLQTVLESEGYIVETAQSGKAALDRLEQINPDILLLDIMMPGLNGYEVTRQVRQHEKFASMPIVLLTAHDEFFQKPYREVGANDLIRKPIDFDELLDKVANYTQSHSRVA
ncbi:response regulator [Leptolyngbya sp. NIES-2104]|uniref:response regulator n=1 Tax=Leptolyngbya sp. NIES-2104 TaxID=1552121 RepID=UPI0006EC79F4|nr:response regulator [Leptolyngbya sp. NIES-2104]GAP98343.1 two-component hybrid sensor and regulator [Leptolyngbya sp. NIES-2104]